MGIIAYTLHLAEGRHVLHTSLGMGIEFDGAILVALWPCCLTMLEGEALYENGMVCFALYKNHRHITEYVIYVALCTWH